MRPGRVHGFEWLVALAGIVMLAGLFLSWSDNGSGFGSYPTLAVWLALAGIAAVLVPVVVSLSRLTDVPVVWETLLWLASLPLLVATVIAVLLTPPSLSHGGGFWVSLLGLIVLGLAGWRSVRREH